MRSNRSKWETEIADEHDQNGNETTKSDICRVKSGEMFGVYLNRFRSEMFGHLVLAVGVLCAVCVHSI